MATITLQSNAFDLNGDYNVVGRSIVMDAQADNSGRRNTASSSGFTSHLACGIIGVETEEVTNNNIQQTNMNVIRG